MKNRRRWESLKTNDDPLCCCEYRDLSGSRSHILACCCDCEALDSFVDSLFRGHWSSEAFSETWDTIEDRLRIPMYRGAVKIDSEVLVPLLVVPLSLLLGAVHPVLSALVLVCLPAFMYARYRSWKRRKGGRTRMFFAWGIVSVLHAYLTFEAIVMPMKHVELWENLLLTLLVSTMFYVMYVARKGPGYVQLDPTHSHSKPSQEKVHDDEPHEEVSESTERKHDNGDCNCCDSDKPQDYGPMGNMMIGMFGMDPSVIDERIEAQRRAEHKLMHAIPPQLVDWVDSRLTSEGYINRWCEKCNTVMPARAAHCRVCNVCVLGRDHHCVWIDCCVGANNHRSFVLAVLLYIIASLYGCYLSLSSVCPPTSNFKWYIVPADCPVMYLYMDFSSGLITVTCCYALLSALFMTLTLLTQVNTISQDVTGNELYCAGVSGQTSCCGFRAKNNVNNTGFIKNWFKFIIDSRYKNKFYPNTVDEVSYNLNV